MKRSRVALSLSKTEWIASLVTGCSGGHAPNAPAKAECLLSGPFKGTFSWRTFGARARCERVLVASACGSPLGGERAHRALAPRSRHVAVHLNEVSL
jgi:hypothetical protein